MRKLGTFKLINYIISKISKHKIGIIISVLAIILITVIFAVTFKNKAVNSKKINTLTKTNENASNSASQTSSELVSSEQDVSSATQNEIGLVITSPAQLKTSTTDPTITFTGTSDPGAELTVNNNEIERDASGLFNFTVDLKIGNNYFVFKHKEKTVEYIINYRFVVINGYNPSKAQNYQSGTKLVANVTARVGSTVTATLNGETITLNCGSNQNSEAEQGITENSSAFAIYSGIFNLPSGNIGDISLGKITYKAVFEGKSESFYSGNITVLKDANVNYIAEIVEYNAETFDGKVTDSVSIDYSRPTNNYLPKGTVDYTNGNFLKTNDKTYVTLRSGQRVYLEHTDKPNKVIKPVVSLKTGTLPDHNEITLSAFEQVDRHTVIKLNTMWKAPFYFNLLPQSYTNPTKQDYTITNVTFTYIDIKFCYATVFNNSFNAMPENPLFSSYEIINNSDSHTLRLYLKNKGAFYGWDAYYDDNGMLCFEFLNPLQIKTANNDYGADLSGAKILIDVGHGGIDIGAPGFDYVNHSEAIQNLNLAKKLKAELESLGATVFLTRTSDTTSSSDDKIKMLKSIKPDYCIAIHHDSNNSSKLSGFGAYYYTPFSKNASEYIYFSNLNTGIYTKSTLLWHYYFMARVTNCPVVLTENGYMSNQYDYTRIISDEFNIAKAQAITKGIVSYFKSIGQIN